MWSDSDELEGRFFLKDSFYSNLEIMPGSKIELGPKKNFQSKKPIFGVKIQGRGTWFSKIPKKISKFYNGVVARIHYAKVVGSTQEWQYANIGFSLYCNPVAESAGQKSENPKFQIFEISETQKNFFFLGTPLASKTFTFAPFGRKSKSFRA